MGTYVCARLFVSECACWEKSVWERDGRMKQSAHLKTDYATLTQMIIKAKTYANEMNVQTWTVDGLSPIERLPFISLLNDFALIEISPKSRMMFAFRPTIFPQFRSATLHALPSSAFQMAATQHWGTNVHNIISIHSSTHTHTNIHRRKHSTSQHQFGNENYIKRKWHEK